MDLSETARHADIVSALDEADRSVPGIIQDFWGERWLSIDIMDEFETQMLEKDGHLELLRQHLAAQRTRIREDAEYRAFNHDSPGCTVVLTRPMTVDGAGRGSREDRSSWNAQATPRTARRAEPTIQSFARTEPQQHHSNWSITLPWSMAAMGRPDGSLKAMCGSTPRTLKIVW